jgi:hypothetical protein
MFRLHVATIRRTLIQAAAVAGIVALTVLAMRLFAPGQTHAQAAQQGEVRATAFVLVGADGTVLARLAPGSAGNAVLTLMDSTGKPRAYMAGGGFAGMPGGGQMGVLDNDGKPRAQLFYVPNVDSGGVGVPSTKGGGANIIYNPQNDSLGLYIFDPANKFRAALGVRAGNDLDGSYGLLVRDADGNTLAADPPLTPAPSLPTALITVP